jgi:hypothetical protein
VGGWGGWSQNGNREYRFDVGAYTQVDPSVGQNFFGDTVYTGQNPITRMDPYGLKWYNPLDWATDGAAFIAQEGKHRASGSVYNLQFVTLCCLAELFGNTVYTVKVRQHSSLPKWQDDNCRRFTLKENESKKCQDTYATTRKQSIFVNGPGTKFEVDLKSMIHEFYHVINQWDNDRMTRSQYLTSPASWEIEAISSESQEPRLKKCLENNCSCPLLAQ